MTEVDGKSGEAVAPLRAGVELVRPVNAVFAGVLTLVGAFVVGGFRTHLWAVLGATLITILATASGNAINDYFDRTADRINHPERPIPSGRISAQSALILALAGFVLSLVLSLSFGFPFAAVGLVWVNIVLLIAYTPILKRLPGLGNTTVAYLGGSTLLFGAIVAGSPTLGIVLGALAACSTFAREVVKDVEDLTGDVESGVRSLPVVIGATPAVTIGSVVLVIALFASPFPYVDGAFGWPYLAVVAPADLAMAIGAGIAYRTPERGQQLLKYGMMVAALAFLVGRLTT